MTHTTPLPISKVTNRPSILLSIVYRVNGGIVNQKCMYIEDSVSSTFVSLTMENKLYI